MSVRDDPWSSLAVPHEESAISARRVSEANPWGFYWARDSEGRYLLVLNHHSASSPRERLPRLKGIEVFIRAATGDPKPNMVLRLLDSTLRDIFHRLCLDIVASTNAAASESAAVAVALARTWRWHHLLRGGVGGLLSADEQKGLIGELLVLERYILPSMSEFEAMAAWRGPLGEPKDFVVGRTAVESKARGSSTASAVHISSEFQLDDADTDALFLHLSVLDAVNVDSDQGFSVADVACRIRDQLSDANSQAIDRYNALLSAAGFRYEDDYSGARWQGGERGIYRVEGAFPRLTPATVPAGIAAVTYLLSLGACGSFLVDPATFAASITGARNVN